MDRDVKEVLARVGALSLAGQLPDDRAAVWALLRREGFGDEALRAALEEPPPELSRDTPPAPVARLTEDATAFLNGLRDLGYLDDELEDQALDVLMAEDGALVGIEAMRQAVATVLFDRQFDLEPDTLRFLEEEWRLAFH